MKSLSHLASFAVIFAILAITLFVPSARSAADDRPNIVFIITDQQSADVMSCCMGDKHIHTPAMDSLASSGTLFSRAYVSNPLCMPARNSIFTGHHPHTTDVTKNGYSSSTSFASKFVSMGNYLQDAGYKAAYSGKWHLCFKQSDQSQHGFEILDAKSSVEPPADNNYDSRVARGAVDFLKRKQDRPFLLVVSLMNPHNICEWARRAAGREQRLSCGEIGTPPTDLDLLPPAPANLEVPQNEPDGMIFIRKAYQHDKGLFPVSRFTAEDWRRQRWGYYRMVEKVDSEIAKVLDAIKAAGEEENTLVIFTSDHGDCTGAHRFNQKTVFYEESVRIPFIVSWKGKTKQAVSDKLVNTGIDILPTMMAAAGIEKPAKLPGRNILPIVTGQSPNEWREYLVAQNNLAQTGKIDGMKPSMQGRMVRSERYKYCLYEFGTRREALYDMKSDPLETVNLAVDPAYREVILDHRAKLKEFAKANNDPLVAELLKDDVAPRAFGE